MNVLPFSHLGLQGEGGGGVRKWNELWGKIGH